MEPYRYNTKQKVAYFMAPAFIIVGILAYALLIPFLLVPIWGSIDAVITGWGLVSELSVIMLLAFLTILISLLLWYVAMRFLLSRREMEEITIPDIRRVPPQQRAFARLLVFTYPPQRALIDFLYRNRSGDGSRGAENK